MINANLAELLQTIFQEITNEKNANATISDICSISVPKINVDNLTVNNYWSNSNLLPDKQGATIAEKLPKVKKVNKVSIGDTLFGNIRPYFKKVYYAPNTGGASTDLICFHPKSPLMKEYLFSIIYSNQFIESIVKSSKGTKMPRGDKSQMMDYTIYIPSKESNHFIILLAN